MGPYCNFCGRRCFLVRVLADGRTMMLATCATGMKHDRQAVGQDHTTALNPVTEQDAVQQLADELAEMAARARAVLDVY